MSAGYDVIGDVHGYADKLVGLLVELGYSPSDGVWSHPQRTAIFIGDLIDRGPHQRRTVDLVRAMVDACKAKIVLGNHEFNAIAWATRNPEVPHEYLRPRFGDLGRKNRHQHKEFLAEVGEDSSLHRTYIDWFRSIPVWLELDGLRIIHACWDTAAMNVVERWLSNDRSVTNALMIEGSRRGSAEYKAIEILLKGPEIQLPDGYAYLDKDKQKRSEARLRWWDGTATTLRRAAEIPSHSKTPEGTDFPDLPDTPIGTGVVTPYTDDIPVLYGHYWRSGELLVDSDVTACVDYSAGSGDDTPLVAYRWNLGDRKLAKENLVAFPHQH
jgi:Calcineurin-like phosphoesterase